MYWSWKSITEEDVDEVELEPEDYFDLKRYERSYKGDRNAIKRYLYSAHAYAFLAFAYQLKNLNLPDPLERMHTRWLIDILDRREFIDIHNHLRSYYPEFATEVNRLLGIEHTEDSRK
jgi:hypothetical protein